MNLALLTTKSPLAVLPTDELVPRRDLPGCGAEHVQRFALCGVDEVLRTMHARKAEVAGRPPLERVRRSLPRPLDAARGRYFVRAADGEALAALGAAAWKIAPQDKCLGSETRRRNLPLVVSNARALPWPGTSRPMSSPWTNGGCPTTGSPATLRSCSRPSAKRRASQEPATGQPARSARPKAATSSISGVNVFSRSRMLKPLRQDWKRILKK